MFLAAVIAIFTVLASVYLHLVNISVVADRVTSERKSQFVKTPSIVCIAVISQMLIAGLFTVAYISAISMDLGEFKQTTNVLDIFYFSLTTITTLGLGSIEPTGHLRMVAGIESATGFLLISCSAQKVFRSMG